MKLIAAGVISAHRMRPGKLAVWSSKRRKRFDQPNVVGGDVVGREAGRAFDHSGADNRRDRYQDNYDQTKHSQLVLQQSPPGITPQRGTAHKLAFCDRRFRWYVNQIRISAHLISHPWIEIRVGNVDQQVHQQQRDRDKRNDADDERLVTIEGCLNEIVPQSGQREDPLDYDRPG